MRVGALRGEGEGALEGGDGGWEVRGLEVHYAEIEVRGGGLLDRIAIDRGTRARWVQRQPSKALKRVQGSKEELTSSHRPSWPPPSPPSQEHVYPLLAPFVPRALPDPIWSSAV